MTPVVRAVWHLLSVLEVELQAVPHPEYLVTVTRYSHILVSLVRKRMLVVTVNVSQEASSVVRTANFTHRTSIEAYNCYIIMWASDKERIA